MAAPYMDKNADLESQADVSTVFSGNQGFAEGTVKFASRNPQLERTMTNLSGRGVVHPSTRLPVQFRTLSIHVDDQQARGTLSNSVASKEKKSYLSWFHGADKAKMLSKELNGADLLFYMISKT